jgi:hypothetical protein
MKGVKKMTIKNTAESNPLENFMSMHTGGIEAQEKQGQREFCNSLQLPKEGSEFYKKMGIEVLQDSSGDDLFVDVKLPKGWKIEPQDHSMWSDLLDQDGNKKGAMFYKAAFYDRDAFFQKAD